MWRRRFSLAAWLAVCLLGGGRAAAEVPVTPTLPPLDTTPAVNAFEREFFGIGHPAPLDESLYASDDLPLVVPPPQLSLTDERACGDGCGSWWTAWKARDPWKMPQPCFLQRCGIVTGGWLQHGITFNSRNPTDGFNSVTVLNDRDGEYQLNQLWFYLHRPADNGGAGVAWGGHVDVVYGTDWRFGRSFGLEDRINGDDQFYGLVIPQAYLELAVDRLSIKLGHFASMMGYEVVPATGNFFYSHSLAMSYTEPQLVTGMIADYRLTDQWTVLAGFHRGWYMFEDLNNRLDVIGGVKWASLDRRTSVSYMFTTGDQSNPVFPAGENWFASVLMVQHQWTERTNYVFQHNLGVADDLAFGNDAEWYGIVQYLTYTMSDTWSLGMRLEWLRDDDGVRVAGIGNLLGTDAGWQGGPGYAGNFWALSLGVNYKPKPNVWFRPEVRWDWYDGPENVLDGTLPFGDFDRRNQFTFGCDMVILF